MQIINIRHSPGGGTTFAKRRHDDSNYIPPYRLVKVSWKSVQPFPRTVVSFFFDGRKKNKKKQKKNKKKQKKTYVKHKRYRLIGGCINQSKLSSSVKSWQIKHTRPLSPRKVKVVTQLFLGPNISKRAGDRGLVTMEHE